MPQTPNSALPEGFVPDSGVQSNQPVAQQAPEGFVPDSAVQDVQPAVPGAPAGFVPDSEAKSVLTQSEYLSKLPHAQIISQVPKDLAEAYTAGTATPEQTAALQPYIDAYRARADRHEFIQSNDLPEDQRPKEAPIDDNLNTGSPNLDGALAALNAPLKLLPDYVTRAAQGMEKGLITQGNEAVKGLTGADPLTGRPLISDQEINQAQANSIAGLKLGTFQAANMLRTAFNRTANQFFAPRGKDANGKDVYLDPSFEGARNDVYDMQFKQDLQARQIEQHIATQAPGKHFVAPQEDVARAVAGSPFAMPPLAIPGLNALHAATEGGLAARILTGEAEVSAAAAGRQLAGKALGAPISGVAGALRPAAKIIDSNPVAAGVIAATGTALGGGDAKDVVLAGLFAAGAEKAGLLTKAVESTQGVADKLAGRIPAGPMGRFAARAFDNTAAAVQPLVVGQLANTPFLLGADDEDQFKTLLAGGMLAHAAGHVGGSAANALDIGRNLWATTPTLPESRVSIKDYGQDPELDAAHGRAMDKVGNSGNNFVQAVRDYFNKQDGETYVLLPQDFNAALDRAAASGHFDVAANAAGITPAEYAQQAKGQAGLTYAAPGSDGARNITLNKLGEHTPGISVGHEAGHLLESLLTPEELQSAYKMAGQVYGPDQVELYRQKYESLANRNLPDGTPPVQLSTAGALSEIFAEHVNAVLNSIPIAQFSDPKANPLVVREFARSIYSLVGRGLEKIGAKVPELQDSTGTKTGTGIEPSARLGHLIENALQAHQLDQPIMNGTQDIGQPAEPQPLSLNVTSRNASEIPNSRPVEERPLTQGFKKGDPIGEVHSTDGTLLAEDAKVTKVLGDANGTRHYEIEYTHPDSGEKMVGNVPESWLLSKKGVPKAGEPEVIFPEHVVDPESPQGARTTTPTDKLPVPNQVENTIRPEGLVPAEDAPKPNVRTTRARQAGFEKAGTPEEQLANEKLFTAAAADRSKATPFEIEHAGAVDTTKAPDQIVRERQRLASEATGDSGLKKVFQKIFVPFRVQDTSSGKTSFGLSMDKVIQNVDMLRSWQRTHGGEDPYLASHDLVVDIQDYLKNQANGYSGGGESLVRPADTKPGSITAENKDFKPTPLARDRVEKINALMGYNPADLVNKSTKAASEFFKTFAEGNGLKPRALENGLTEVNPYRDALRKAGFNLKLLNQATEQIRLRDIVGVAKPRPDLDFGAGDTGITKGGFMPDVQHEGEKT